MITLKLLSFVKFPSASQRGFFSSWDARLHCRRSFFVSSVNHSDVKGAFQLSIEQENSDSSLPNVSPNPVDEVRRPNYILHEQVELRAYHEILEKLPAYQNSLFTKKDLQAHLQPSDSSHAIDLIQRDWSAPQKAEVLDAFRIVTSYAVDQNTPISDDQFSPLCYALKDCLQTCSFDDILEIGKLLTLWPPVESTHSKNFKMLFTNLDEAAIRLYREQWQDMNLTQILKVMDIWFWLRLGRLNHFIRMALPYLLHKAKEPHLVIQLMFNLSQLHSLPMSNKAYDIEKKLYNNKDSCSLDEIGCAVYGLFRSKSSLQYRPLVLHILKRLLLEADTVSPLILTGLCKSLRLSIPPEYRPALEPLQIKLLHRIPDLPNETISAIIWLGSHNRVINESVLKAAYLKMSENMDKVRIKDLTKLLSVCCEYQPKGIDLKEYAEKLLVELCKKKNQTWMQKKDFILGSALHRILLCGVFPRDIIHEFLSSRTAVNDSIAALGLDVHVEIFHPNYDGARLDPILRKDVFNYRFRREKGETFVHSHGRVGRASSFNTKLLKKIKGTLLQVVDGKEECMLQTYIVPSSGFADVVFCVDKEGNFQPIPDFLKQIPEWEVKRISPDYLNKDLHFIALSILEKFHEEQVLCFQFEKKKMLEVLGYIPVKVDLAHWTRIFESERVNYILSEVQTIVTGLNG